MQMPMDEADLKAAVGKGAVRAAEAIDVGGRLRAAVRLPSSIHLLAVHMIGWEACNTRLPAATCLSSSSIPLMLATRPTVRLHHTHTDRAVRGRGQCRGWYASPGVREKVQALALARELQLGLDPELELELKQWQDMVGRGIWVVYRAAWNQMDLATDTRTAQVQHTAEEYLTAKAPPRTSRAMLRGMVIQALRGMVVRQHMDRAVEAEAVGPGDLMHIPLGMTGLYTFR